MKTSETETETETGVVARQAALDLLQAVLRRRQALDEALARDKALAALEPRDRAFARLLVATVLRRLGQIDRVIGKCVDKPLPRRAAGAQDLLRLGAAQLLFLGTPPHAAVDSAVRQAAARAETGGYKALVNAVLRRLAREGEALLGASDEARDNVPDWLWVSWQAAYGEATARAIARAHLTEPPLDLSFKGEAETWTGLGAVLLPTGTVRLSREARSAERMVEALPGFEEGAWWVQDAAAALPVRLLGDVTAKTVLDLCAAPGGKTAQLAAAGARVVAVDRAEARLDLLRRNLTRLRLSAETINADAATWRPETPAPAVLLDAPCSATGTIRRHPDVAWLKRPEDVTRMAAAQDRLLQAAVEMTAPGGVLVYCVCSLQPEEGPERIAALLAAGAPVERERIEPAEIGGLAELISPEGDLRTLPCHLAEQGGLDGFFAARLRRR